MWLADWNFLLETVESRTLDRGVEQYHTIPSHTSVYSMSVGVCQMSNRYIINGRCRSISMFTFGDMWPQSFCSKLSHLITTVWPCFWSPIIWTAGYQAINKSKCCHWLQVGRIRLEIQILSQIYSIVLDDSSQHSRLEMTQEISSDPVRGKCGLRSDVVGVFT